MANLLNLVGACTDGLEPPSGLNIVGKVVRNSADQETRLPIKQRDEVDGRKVIPLVSVQVDVLAERLHADKARAVNPCAGAKPSSRRQDRPLQLLAASADIANLRWQTAV